MKRFFPWFGKALVPVLLILVLFFPPSFLEKFNRLDMVFLILLAWVAFWTVHAIRHWKKYVQIDKEKYFKRLIVYSSVIIFFILLGAIDFFLERRYSTSGLMVLGNNAQGFELHTLDLYPYTVFHPRANCHVQGPMPLEANPVYQDFDVHSGDHGFFVDFDLDDPPPKEKNEFRIILIGGSAAQGFGGQTNDHMFYRLLEKKLQKDCVAVHEKL